MAQLNPKVGAIADNTAKIIDIIQTHQHDHDLIVFPELVLTGYPPEDHLFRGELYLQVDAALKKIQEITKNQIKKIDSNKNHTSKIIHLKS